MVDDHEGFADQHLVAVAQRNQRRDILGVERQRLLDQHVFLRLDRLAAHSTCCEVGTGM